ncbi:hypothetical protein GO986_00565 [Deinococcus sp. HMF7620]|uniref:Uncharacterized protein n=1 Tax=Deinococcus arboris TaxID=2682977 RepID=A0A7C9M5Q2_9DEIO|nr:MULTISPECIES: hypothetical protein [Deinococcus]MBZ9752666.1 hypothetical protein [Deinococcus betulae]MVN85263.1 hypothetical protein [Deinococcus arboris]
MTQPEGAEGPGPAATPGGRGEVLISGLDTGPRPEERANLSPTQDHARFVPPHPAQEPTDEDG